MDKDLRNILRNVVTKCRKLLEEAIGELLQGQFGIHSDGKVEDASRLTHLSPDDLRYRNEVLAHLEHIKASGLESNDATDQLIREAAFTHLNRLCAYKMMTSRGLIEDPVGKGIKSRGFMFYLADHPDDEVFYRGAREDVAYRHYFDWLNDGLSAEIGVLFEREDVATPLFPPYRVLIKVLDLINSEELAGIWTEDETTGWVYQYFTPKELRDQARKESAAPRNSYELAFRNQFYTPRYVVEFLVDNTLGRIWYEMRKGKTTLSEKCQYLVRRPNEVFLSPDEELPANQANAMLDSSQEEFSKSATYIKHRQKKDPREIRILDPACGSGHFLLYCFGLMELIYEEAYQDESLGPALQSDYATLEDLRREVPKLILDHNLHGVDIDLRATQISALALWLRCHRTYQMLGVTNGARPQIRKANIVCAEPMPGERELLEEFVRDIYPPFLGDVVRVVFQNMRLAGEAGTLLKIEEEISEAISEAKKHWREVPQQQQLALFRKEKLSDGKQGALFDLSGITDEQFWEEAEARVLESLSEYLNKVATNGQALLRRLFADDAAQGFAFVDTCRKQFDVVVMNPPFGDMPDRVSAYLADRYPITKYDLATAFVERAISYLHTGGRLGWISSRTWFSLSSLERFRKDVLYRNSALTDVVDLGIGVLDSALVETACCIVEAGGTFSPFVFTLRLLSSRSKETDLLKAVQRRKMSSVPIETMRELPRGAFGYWFPNSFARRLREIPRFNAWGGDAKQGLATTDDFRFLRCWWEVPSVGIHHRWVPFAKGGEYEPYYDDLHLVIDYADNGRVLKEYLMKEKRQKHWSRRIASADYYGRPGLTYPERTTSDLSLRPLPSEAIFSATGQAVFLPSTQLSLRYLGLTYSRVFKQLLELFVGSGDASESGSAARDYTSGILNEMPVPQLLEDDHAFIEELVMRAINIRRKETRGAEDSCDFVVASMLETTDATSLTEKINGAVSIYRNGVDSLLEIGEKIDDWGANIYGLTEIQDKKFLAEEVCTYPLDYPEVEILGSQVAEATMLSLPSLVETLCETYGYRRAFTKKAYWGNRRIELTAHLFKVNPRCLKAITGIDLTRHLVTPTADLLSYFFGAVLGRWDLRVAMGIRSVPASPDPFASPSVCAPGALTGMDGLPSHESPPGYPLRVDWDGILVDDPDQEDDIIRRVRDVFELLWPPGSVDEIEREACELLGVRELRDYFRKLASGGFWMDHVRRYSKSRRKAPIYWLLRSSKGNYAIWLYYHRLDKDILYKALLNYVEPKLRLEENNLSQLRQQRDIVGTTGREAKQLEKELDKQESLISELHDFHGKLKRAADLHLEPDLNDGVVLNIAPLWELVPWAEAKKYWKELTEGKYEWSTISKQLRERGLLKE